jgi:DnaJ family protein A protein 2
MEKEITLHEALTGVDFTVTHLDGKKFRVKSNPGEVIIPDSLKTISDKGLPFHKQSYKYGNLFIMFKVKFPTKLGAAQITAASQALSMQKKPDVEMDVEDVQTLEKYSESQRNTKAGLEDSDEEEEGGHGHGGQRVQCAQQ